ncbi:hypothetical protein PUN28_014996 [Cardiocondyla obscurior]|uniref:Uncharacterized protein n=1 Tax=Cardiocondyla obscurior TaxID=286306 RepID=A0AAW2EWC8_9HYME
MRDGGSVPSVSSGDDTFYDRSLSHHLFYIRSCFCRSVDGICIVASQAHKILRFTAACLPSARAGGPSSLRSRPRRPATLFARVYFHAARKNDRSRDAARRNYIPDPSPSHYFHILSQRPDNNIVEKTRRAKVSRRSRVAGGKINARTL